MGNGWMTKIPTRNCLTLFNQFSIETREPCTCVDGFSPSLQIKQHLPKTDMPEVPND